MAAVHSALGRRRAADGGSARRWSRRRVGDEGVGALDDRCGGRCGRSGASRGAWTASEARSVSAMARSPLSVWSGLSGRTQPRTETPVRSTSMGCVEGGSSSSACLTAAGRPRRERRCGLVGGEFERRWGACRGRAGRRLLQTRSWRRGRGCRSRDSAGRCRCGRRCRWRCCRRACRRGRRISWA